MSRRTRQTGIGLALAGLTLIGLALGGCQIVGAMAGSERLHGSHDVKAKYSGLAGKNFAVVVAADRAIQSDFPAIVPITTREMTTRLAENTAAKGYLPADEVLKYQARHPGWVAKGPADLAKELGVERVVYVDLSDFALTDPGNPYVYNGVAAGNIHVVEADGPTPGEFAFSEPVRVKFPDFDGLSPSQLPREAVMTELARRLIERSAWMFYEHEEKNTIKY